MKGLKNVTLTGTLTGISTNAFVNSTDLVNVVMGNAVRTIGSSAFLGCNSLESVRMGLGLTTIDASAFYGCVSLTSVRMGGNEKSIGANAFKGCTALAAIELPATLTSLGNSAFEDCKVLTSVNLPEGLTQISAGTFNGCLRLPEITIPDAVTTVGSNAFYGCAALTIVQVPDAVTSIGDNAFSQCSALNYVYVGRGIRTIGSTAFGNCPMIKGFYVLSTEVPTANTNAFNGSDPAAIKLYVPDESTAAYAAKSPWSSFAATIGLSEAPIYANSITLDPEVLIMSDDPYDETKIEFTLLPANATNNKVTWQSSNTSVATVSRTGLVTPEAEGVATITATASDKYGARATALVIIANDFVPMESISLDHPALTLTEGESLQLMPTTEPYDATYDVITWISSDERVATVDATGVVTAVRKGQATIIAQTSDGTKLRSQCALTVEEPTYASLTTIGDANGDGLVSNADLRAVVALLLGQHGGVDVSFDVNRDGHIGIADITTIIDALQKEGALPSGPVKCMKLNAEQYDVVVGEARTITTTLVPFRSGSHIDWTVSDPAFISLDATYGSSVTFTALLPGKVTITASTNDGTDISASITVNITPNNQGTADGHAWVDLGLPSGTRWATMNIGASTPEAYGDYIAWGEKTAKQTYDWTTYALCNGSATTLTKYCTATANGKRDDKTSLESADDAAAQRWSSNWSTPSREQLAELFNNAYTTTVWTTQGGIYGRKVTSKANGSSIFLPAAGYVSEFGPSSRGTGGYYASRTLANPSTKAYGVNFGESTITTDDASFRSVGQSVRPVLSPALRLDFTSMQLIKGERYDLARTLSTTDAPPASMLWSSSNPAVAIVSEAGEVHAVEAGTTTIYATLNDGSGVTATITLNVNEALVISGGSNSLRLGKTMQLSVNTACPVTWSSSDLGVATVSNSGLVTAINAGKTTITAIASNGISAQYNIISVRETVCFTVNGVTFNMQLVEHGTFQMGSESGDSDEKPVHSVTISKDYYIGETEVTQGLWYAVMGQKPTNSGSQWKSSYGLGDNYPAYYISWNDCQEFITKLNQLTGQTFRMPTEAEWEYAARGGNKSQGYTYSGSNTIDEVAWYSSNSSSSTHPVATKKANELGLYDMSGNVWEWCSDWYGSYSSAAVTDPVGATSGSNRVARGGSRGGNATICRAANRGNFTPTDRGNLLGFRLALSPSGSSADTEGGTGSQTGNNAEQRSFTANGVTFNMQLVEHGTFQMGSEDGYSREQPVHSVTISQDYYIGETEVTQGLWYAVTGTKLTDITTANGWSTYGVGDNYPMYDISWNDCQEFITKLNQLTGQTFRLPTEAEWDYAAKGGNKSQGYTYSGSNNIEDVAWYTSNSSSSTHPVATKKANELGLYDMSGNVWEWCSDRYGSYSSAAVTDPVGTTSGSYRVSRGGSWYGDASICRTAFRDYINPTSRYNVIGFRLCLSPSGSSADTEGGTGSQTGNNAEQRSFTANGVTFNMQLVEHGTFQMGSEDGYSDLKPVHSVTISQDYYIGETEVTQGLWYAVTGTKLTDIMTANGWSTYGVGDDYPMYDISWNDCQEFITKLNQLTGQTFRLPTEAEWEYAAKGGNKSQGYTYSGSNTVDEVAWYFGNSTHPVATKKANELGLYDMSGNVWEWCSDWYGSYSSAAVTDPVGATSGSYRVLRGGSWSHDATICRAASRNGYDPTVRGGGIGFRLCLSPSK